ncbi:PTS sugar transporter subunit IIA, partial [Desulfosarcina sp.]|nr:PTS sugar transporter subunit IIA [Desulfosarcina sp.]
MKLASILNADLINLQLQATSKSEAFIEMVRMACAYDKSLDEKVLLDSVVAREEQQSTYMGHGLAIPHARIDDLKDFLIVCGKSAQGIKYDDSGKSAQLIVMILSCKTKISILLQTTAAFATIFSDDALSGRLLSETEAKDFIRIIDEANINLKESLVAKDIMLKNIVSISLDNTLKDVLDLFFEKNISGAPVLNEDGTIAGVLTEKELINLGLPKYMGSMDNISFLNDFEPFQKIFEKEDELRVKDICQKNFITVHENTAVIQVAFYFVHKNCR